MNYRPEYRQQWGSKTHYTQLRLSPLGKEDAEELLAALLGNVGGMTGTSQRFILEKTEGNPFFMEEIVQALVEQGVLTDLRRAGAAHLNAGVTGRSPLPTDIHLPPPCKAVLAARIDRLPPEEKEFLQTLPLSAKSFPSTCSSRWTNRAEDELQRLLSQLQAAEFIYEQPAFPDSPSIFLNMRSHRKWHTILCSSNAARCCMNARPRQSNHYFTPS